MQNFKEVPVFWQHLITKTHVQWKIMGKKAILATGGIFAHKTG
jgi:hypothetical protein